MIKKEKNAFTLAEVLITLAMIGVVASLTIPTLVKKYEEKILITKLQQTYAILSEVNKYAVIEHDEPQYWDIGPVDSSAGSLKLYNIYKPYFRKLKDCGSQKGCFADHYKALFNDNFVVQPSTHSVYARGVLSNGVSFLVWSNGLCDNYRCGSIFVDLNGFQKPNQAGVDFFMFLIHPTNGIIPAGQLMKIYGSDRCIYKDTNSTNGTHCTYWALSRKNMDYLRRDIDSEW